MKCDICKKEKHITKKCMHEKAIEKGISNACHNCCMKCSHKEIYGTGLRCSLNKESEKTDA